jgi:flavin reductase (DIM6/NTAB) family NADH-FMN oxidoreductase RutF
LFCELLQVIELGTHHVFIGEIMHEMIDKDCYEDKAFRFSRINPIVYCPDNYMLITDSVGPFLHFRKK